MSNKQKAIEALKDALGCLTRVEFSQEGKSGKFAPIANQIHKCINDLEKIV